MLLFTVVYKNDFEEIVNGLEEFKKINRDKNINICISESLSENNHIIKIFCDDKDYNQKVTNMFYIYMANIIFFIIIEEFIRKNLTDYLNNTYFFLREEEAEEIIMTSKDLIKSDIPVKDDFSIFFLNRKNNMMKKITKCLKENNEININGFMTFRIKNLMNDFEAIIDKITEKYMVEKEYDEFIKLLKYFVEIQESKIDLLNIIILNDGSYTVKDKAGKSMMKELLNELTEVKNYESICTEDLIISGLITNSPKKIIVHCVENCINKDFINTIKNVFTNRVIFCSECKICSKIKSEVNL
jgi:putative sporulation protein YtxC